MFPIIILRNINKSDLQLPLFEYYEMDMVNPDRKKYFVHILSD